MYEIDPNANINGVSFNDTKITTSYDKMVDVFGPPQEAGDKSQAMWYFKDRKTGNVFVVGDWKEGEDITETGKEYEFNIYSKKGFLPESLFKDWLEIQLK